MSLRYNCIRKVCVLLLVFLSQEGSQYSLEATVNFRWGITNHIRVKNFEIFEGIDKLFDKLELKVVKEKNKVQDHKGHDSVRAGTPEA